MKEGLAHGSTSGLNAWTALLPSKNVYFLLVVDVEECV